MRKDTGKPKTNAPGASQTLPRAKKKIKNNAIGNDVPSPGSATAEGWRTRIVAEGSVDPRTLIPNPKNWRVHPKIQQSALTEVLDKLGWVQRVIVNRKSGHIIDGHLRVEMALEKHEKSVPVCYVELNEEEERTVLATFDPLGAIARTDQGILEGLILDMQSVDSGLADLMRRIAEDANALPFEGENPADHWKGLPEFENENDPNFKSVILHFKTEEDLESYSELTGQKITEKTRSIYYPPRENEDKMDKVYHA